VFVRKREGGEGERGVLVGWCECAEDVG
jgi:hypothetical protein